MTSENPVDNVSGLWTENISVSGNVYRYAAPSAHTPEPVNLGNIRVGGSFGTQALSVTNTAANDGYSEKLNAAIGSPTGAASANGSFSLLGAGSTNSSGLVVGLGNANTATAGLKSGKATISFVSDGAGTSRLGQTPLASQDVQVSGAVYRLATGGATPTPLDLGNFRLTTPTLSANLAVQNTAAADGYSEQLGVQSVTPSNGLLTATNDLGASRLDAGATVSNAITVGLGSGLSAGVNTGSVAIQYLSDGTVSGTGAPIASNLQNVDVTATGYRLAVGDTTPLTVTFTNRHVGDGASQALTVQNLAATDGYSEKLNASFGTPTGTGVTTNGGGVGLLAAGGSSSAMAVGIDTSSAGAKGGTVAVTYQSDGTGTSGFAAIGAGSQTVNVSGNVYRLASAQIDNAGSFSFGSVHVGDTVAQALSITNAVVNDGFSEKLNASFGSTSDGRILTSGSISRLGAGVTDTTSMVIGVDTAAAGVVNGTATVNFASDGTGTSGLGITALSSQGVSVSASIQGDVYRYANPVIQTAQPVNLGNIRVGGSFGTQALSIKNDVLADGFSERLNASADGTTGGATASGSFNLLAAQGVDSSSIVVGLGNADTGVAGAKSGAATIDFVSDGAGTSGLGQTPLASQAVQVSGAVYQVAQPAVPDSVNLGNFRLGSAPTQAATITNTAVRRSATRRGCDATRRRDVGQGQRECGPSSIWRRAARRLRSASA